MQLEISAGFRALKDWTPTQTRSQGVILITDRASDATAPLMHEFTYQSLMNEILPIEGEIIKSVL